MGNGWEWTGTRFGPLPGFERWKPFASMTAVARGNLFGIDGDLVNRPTPRLALGAARLCDDLEVARSRR